MIEFSERVCVCVCVYHLKGFDTKTQRMGTHQMVPGLVVCHVLTMYKFYMFTKSVRNFDIRAWLAMYIYLCGSYMCCSCIYVYKRIMKCTLIQRSACCYVGFSFHDVRAMELARRKNGYGKERIICWAYFVGVVVVYIDSSIHSIQVRLRWIRNDNVCEICFGLFFALFVYSCCYHRCN